MSTTINSQYQVGQKLGPGTIVNPSKVTSEHLKDAKLVTVLVPNSLEKSDQLELTTTKSKQSFNKDKALQSFARAALGGTIGTLAGLGVTALTKNTTMGLGVGLGVGALTASNPDALHLIDIIGGTVIGAGIGTVAGAAFHSTKLGLAVGVVTGLTAYALSGAAGRI